MITMKFVYENKDIADEIDKIKVITISGQTVADCSDEAERKTPEGFKIVNWY